MGFQGKLKDLSLPDILQVVQLTRKCGVLQLSEGPKRARIVIHEGEVVDAHPPGVGSLTDDLRARGLVSGDPRETRPAPGERIGEALVRHGLIGRDQLESVVRARVEETLRRALEWSDGLFDFEMEDPGGPGGGAAVEVLPGLSFNTQQMLMDALRQIDERRATEGSAAAPESAHREAPRPPEPRVMVVGPEAVRDRIRLALMGIAAERNECESVEVAARLVATEPLRPALVILHLDTANEGLREAISRVSVLARRTAFLTVSDDPSSASSALAAGSFAHVVLLPGDLGPALAYLQSLVAVQLDGLRLAGAPRRLPEPHNPLEQFSSALERLRDRVTTLGSEVHTSSVTMKLLEFVGERFERGLLFLVRPDDLLGLGAFGDSTAGDPIASMASELRIPVGPDSAFLRAIETRAGIVWDVAAAGPADRILPEAIGAPDPPRAFLLPISGLAGPVALIYADNGSSGRGMETEYPDLDVLARQAGVVLENSSLRRMLQKKTNAPAL